jgi:hypothetical protein
MAANAAGDDAELTDREARGSSEDHDGEFVDAEEGQLKVDNSNAGQQENTCVVM